MGSDVGNPTTTVATGQRGVYISCHSTSDRFCWNPKRSSRESGTRKSTPFIFLNVNLKSIGIFLYAMDSVISVLPSITKLHSRHDPPIVRLLALEVVTSYLELTSCQPD